MLPGSGGDTGEPGACESGRFCPRTRRMRLNRDARVGRAHPPTWRSVFSRAPTFVCLFFKNQLQFNRSVPAHSSNLAARYSCPDAIRIEKLTHSSGESYRGGDPGFRAGPDVSGSASFSVISEERLSYAVHLAKRDVRRRQFEQHVRQQRLRSEPQTSQRWGHPEHKVPERREQRKEARGQEMCHCSHETCGRGASCSGAKVHLCTPQPGQPPALEPGPQPHARTGGPRGLLGVQRLQEELTTCVRRMEEVIKRGESNRARHLDGRPRAGGAGSTHSLLWTPAPRSLSTGDKARGL